MPASEVTQGASASDLPRPAGIVESRIDAPHVLGDGPPRTSQPTSMDLAEDEDPTAVETLALVQAQAQQLSSHLRQQAQDIDAREARLQAQMAAFEKEVRTTRLLLAERGQSLDALAAELEDKQRQFDERTAQTAQLEADIRAQVADQAEQWRRQEEEFAARKQQLTLVARRLVQQRLAHQKAADRLRAARRRADRDMRLKQQQIDTRRQASLALAQLLLDGIAQRRAAIEDRERQLDQRAEGMYAGVQQRAGELAARTESLELREQRLTASEELLAEQQSECNLLRNRLSDQQQAFVSARQQAESEWTVRRSEAELTLKQQQHAVERRSQEVDSRRLQLEQLQADLRQMHRESLEMRLAAEELTAQLAGTTSPAIVASSIGRLRAKLADHFRLSAADLAQQRLELEQVQGQLADQHDRLSAQKQDLQQWLERRQDEIEQQAARLVCREQELDWQQQQIESIQSRWHQERQAYQEQIRNLLADLRRRDPLAA